LILKSIKLSAVKSVVLICFLCPGLSSWGGVHAADPVEIVGNVLEFALPICAGGMTVYLRDWQGALQFGEAFTLNEIVTFALKSTVNERRPNGEDNLSFPSGHTSVSCVSAEFMWKRYGWQYGVPMYALAAFVGYSRIESKHHYPHDVAAGAAIGFISAFVFTKRYHGVEISGTALAGRFGIKCTGVF
jgi:membrane-associated phospholipid phosphatase